MIPAILNERQIDLWRAERKAIQHLLQLLAGWEANPADLQRLQDALGQLDELFLLVVVGEFNSGKSALINALLGEAFLPEGVTPTTDQIYVLKYGEPGPPEFAADDVRVLRYPADFLREINIVDTPGTNAVLQRHESLVRDFVPRSDLVIFVTSADRPFTESERAFLEHIRQWGKKIVFVINKIDILESSQAAEEVVEFVREQAERLLGLQLEIFPLSARHAQRAQADGVVDEALWGSSGFPAFRRYLLETLNEESRVRLKLLNPLGVALKITGDYRALAEERLEVLADDRRALEKVERHLALYEEDMRSEFQRHLARIDASLYEMRLRGEEFLDDRVRLRSVMDMLNSRRLREAFERDVVADTPEQIEARVQEVIDWLVERELRQWRLMADELSRRRETEMLRDAAREAASGFAYNRRQLLDSLGAQVQRVLSRYDRSAEARRLVETVQESLAMVGLVEVGAVGLGLLLKALLVGAAADASGLLAAGVLGALGLTIIPYRRRQAKQELRAKTESLRDQLHKALGSTFERELERSLDRLREAIAPYGRFVRSEHQHLQELHTSLDELARELRALQTRIEA